MPTPRHTLNQRLAFNLSRLMAERGLSAAALGTLAGVALNTVGNYLKATTEEAGPTPSRGRERSAKLTEIDRIARALRIEPVELLCPEHEEGASHLVALEPDDHVLISATSRLDKEERTLLIALAHALSKHSTTERKR